MEELSKRILATTNGLLPAPVKFKIKAMQENLFRFYRGTNPLFYEDLSLSSMFPSSPLCWASGDLHLENFGSYKGSNRLVYFDLNDFDDAVLAPAMWELARMVTSIFVAFDSLQIEQKKAFNMARLFLKTYSDTLIGSKPDYIEPRTAKGIVKEFLHVVSERNQGQILTKKTVRKDGKLQMLTDDRKHLAIREDIKKALIDHFNGWLQDDENSPYNYTVKDAVFRLAGTGSLGLKRYALLLKSRNNIGDKYIILDMKQATPSSLQHFVPGYQPAWASEAERIVSIQSRMQNKIPALLSTTTFMDEPYVVQELHPTRDSINFKLIKKEYRSIYKVIDDMALLTASAQLRSAGQQGSAITDELKSFGQAKEWQDAILEYALDYSHQVKKYYFTYLKDCKEGAFRTLETITRSEMNVPYLLSPVKKSENKNIQTMPVKAIA